MGTRLNFLALLLLVLIAFAVGNLGTFWGEARPNGAAMSAQSTASPGKAQSDVSSLAITAGVLTLATICASFLPALKAMRIEPVTALRYE